MPGKGIWTITSPSLSDLPLQIGALRQYLDAADLSQIGRQAHSIKEATANLSAESLRQVAAQMEPAAEEHKLEEVPGLFQNLQGAFERFREAVSGNPASDEPVSPGQRGPLPYPRVRRPPEVMPKAGTVRMEARPKIGNR